jgi:Methyltransferase domain
MSFLGCWQNQGGQLQLKYAVFHAAQAVKQPFQRFTRDRRMRRFLQTVKLQGGERIIDLGGTVQFWAEVPVQLDITILNLPESVPREPVPSHHKITLVAGDACQTGFADDSFHLAFSNSVIEHVGSPENQQRMASEARRLAPNYWVQTPSIWFPIEAHTNMPFWWFYPPGLQRRLIAGWERKLPDWSEMVKGTTVLLHSDLARMFPDGTIWTERFAGLPKSYVVSRIR